MGLRGPKSAHLKGAEETRIGITARDIEVQNQHAKNAEETRICITAKDLEVQKQRAKMPMQRHSALQRRIMSSKSDTSKNDYRASPAREQQKHCGKKDTLHYSVGLLWETNFQVLLCLPNGPPRITMYQLNTRLVTQHQKQRAKMPK